ncbi:hypothetical protein [Sinomonas gamaensis]|uniref:hypothetical protein n=1 Tax=Sinomonas gamaensis TaxID=2565624 RepID=UPI001109FF84|nr:hypothetical protein [Sinomonas gamaensis]
MFEDRVEGEDLIKRIEGCLMVDTQYLERVEEWDVDRVTEIRKAGRAAGKKIGRKVLTHRTPPRGGRVMVYVGIADFTDEENERMDQQVPELLKRAFKDGRSHPIECSSSLGGAQSKHPAAEAGCDHTLVCCCDQGSFRCKSTMMSFTL